MNNEYNDLIDTGYAPPEETAPEDEFFHSIYITGVTRKNHIGIIEEVGKLQIRGIQYNLDEIYFIITHVKTVLVKKEKINEKNRLICFSYQNTKPWKGKDGRICPVSRDDRESTPACKGCRGEIIVSGILTDTNGKPIINENKPIFVFIRGRGIKSPNVYEYLDRLSKMDIEPPIFPNNPTLEKMIAKNKRHVTKVTVTTTNSKHGIKTIFALDIGNRLKDEFVKEVLKIQKKTLQQFNEKFDWTNNIQSSDDDNEYIPETIQPQTETFKLEQFNDNIKNDSFSFDDIKF